MAKIIYDLDNAGGGQIIGEDSAGAPTLEIKSKTATYPALQLKTSAAAGNALVVGKTANSSLTVASLKFLGTSAASAAIMQFAGGMISCTSILFTSAANFDYAIPVVVGGEVRYIPLCTGAAISGGAAF